MGQIMEMIEGLITKFFGGSALPVIRQVVSQILEVVMGLIGRVVPAFAK